MLRKLIAYPINVGEHREDGAPGGGGGGGGGAGVGVGVFRPKMGGGGVRWAGGG